MSGFPKFPIGVRCWHNAVTGKFELMFDDPGVEACALAVHAYWSNPENKPTGAGTAVKALGFTDGQLGVLAGSLTAAFASSSFGRVDEVTAGQRFEVRTKDRG